MEFYNMSDSLLQILINMDMHRFLPKELHVWLGHEIHTGENTAKMHRQQMRWYRQNLLWEQRAGWCSGWVVVTTESI